MRLCINIDHIATLRNARGGSEPDPITAALICERAGVDGIVCHLREDRRHINDNDVARLRASITTKLDLEMAATPEIVKIALKTKPDLVTLVPERRQELTTEGGLDVVRLKSSLRTAIKRFHNHGIPVSLFVDPVRHQVATAKDIGSDMVELHTGEYAEARTQQQRRRLLHTIHTAAQFAFSMDLTVNAGHGLNYKNITGVSKIEEIEEVSIGHAIIAHGIIVGLEQAAKEMLGLVKRRT